MDILSENFKLYGESVIDDLTAYAASQPGWRVAADNYEGIRVNLDQTHGNGWFLLRLSLHDPLLPLNIESQEIGGVSHIVRELLSFLDGYDKLDLTALRVFVQ